MENTHETLTSQAPAKALALTGLFAALSCAGTLALQVPSPTGG